MERTMEQKGEIWNTCDGEAWMTSSFPMRARHVTERANVLRAFPLKLNSIVVTPSLSGDRTRERERESHQFCIGGKK